MGKGPIIDGVYYEEFGNNFVSEVKILPDGFEFAVKVENPCVVSWFILEQEEEHKKHK